MEAALVGELGGVVKLAVRVSTGTAEATHDFGAFAFFDTGAHVEEGNFTFGSVLDNFETGEDAGRASANNEIVVFHKPYSRS